MALVKQKGDYGHTNTSYSDVYILLNSNSFHSLFLPVEGHQHQGEDGDVGGAHDNRLVKLAPDLEVERNM